MVIVNPQSSAVSVQVSTLVAQTRPLVSDSAVADSSDTRPTTCVSNLARQLSAAALRAHARDTALDPHALSHKATQVLSELPGVVDGLDSGPFKGMPRDQLALITYDEAGEFTTSERASARQETVEQEQRWRQSATTRALSEYSSMGKMAGFFDEALAHFKSLPLIEQAQYPTDYAADLQRKTGEQLFNPQEEITKALPEPAYIRPSAAEVNLYATKNSIAAALGRQLLVDRLFDGVEPRVVDGKHGINMENMSRSHLEFLTREDRELFSEIYYAYAQDQSVDLGYVDDIARSVGEYRRHDNGRLLSNLNDGYSYDGQWRQLSVRYNDSDTAAAARILNGSAMSSTRLDQDFLRFALDPGFRGRGHRDDLRFLEHVVNQFSAEGSAGLELDECFSAYPVGDVPVRSIVTASKDVMRPPRTCDGVAEDDEAKESTSAAQLESAELDSLVSRPESLFTMLARLRAGSNSVSRDPTEEKSAEVQVRPESLQKDRS